MGPARFELPELTIFGLRPLTQQCEFEVGHLVPEYFEDLALFDVEGLALTAHIDVRLEFNFLEI